MTLLWLVLRALHFTALMLLVGSAIYSRLLAPVAFRTSLAARLFPLMKWSTWLALLSALAMLATQNVMMSGDWHNLSETAVWLAVFSTRWGAVWQWQLLFSLCSVAAIIMRDRPRQQVWLLTGLLQTGCLALTGHAAMREGIAGLLQQSNQALHLLAAAFWAGGLVPVLVLMRMARNIEYRTAAIRTMMRFSRYGQVAVALTIITGVVNSLLIAGVPANWHLNDYVVLLVCKAGLVMLMVLIALWNRYWLVPRFHIAGLAAQRLFIRMTQLEIVLACGVVGLVSVFATLSPT
ncbi:copper homeostasis membrane protein CopD [Pantoea ananatis]|uniref:copper homeostasis membrane protein CopD n=1 Tax=Pantoea ananas TaxID=553 RepID=UPI00287D531D|nr:copper homeostasis membrane protein CopD [Pantoea ananatis]MDS7721547.1 copper homeostasis membrane protein CopD [Pantoea ananatis]